MFTKIPIYYFFLICISITQYTFAFSSESEAIATQKLQAIHARVHLLFGKFTEEYPEQLMTAMHLPSDARVLELGGNIGRNSCVIASILTDSRNLVSLESCKESADCLQINAIINGLHFHVEPSALSKRPLIQNGWNTIPSDIDLPGYTRVNTITFEELQKKYNIIFDTLVADCEGALYYILNDDPDILKNIKLIIVENDYPNLEQRQSVENLFVSNKFKLIYTKDLNELNFKEDFYQVWKK